MLKRLMKLDCLLGSLLLLIKGVKMSGVINSALTMHVLEPNGIHFTDVFDNFTCMQLIELVHLYETRELCRVQDSTRSCAADLERSTHENALCKLKMLYG